MLTWLFGRNSYWNVWLLPVPEKLGTLTHEIRTAVGLTEASTCAPAMPGLRSCHAAAQRALPPRNPVASGVNVVPFETGDTNPFEHTDSCVVLPPGNDSVNGRLTVVCESSVSARLVPVGATNEPEAGPSA